jgi:uncharacterized protein DUF4279
MNDVYDDNYGTCKETSTSFRIMHPDLDLDAISQQLDLTPTWTRRKGQIYDGRKNPNRISIWALDTEGIITSRDARRHLDWLLDQLEPKAAVLAQFREHGYEMDLYCMWCRLGGTGGPMLSPYQMARMATLELTIGFEFWHVDEEDDTATADDQASNAG